MASKNYRLRIYHDHLTEGAEAVLTSERRIVYCVSGMQCFRAVLVRRRSQTTKVIFLMMR